jgi:hypothetical protein
MIRNVPIALVAGCLVAGLAGPTAAAAQGSGPQVQADRERGKQAIRFVMGECRGQLGAQASDPTIVRSCVKERTKPFRKACKRDARGQGFAKGSDEFKAFSKACVANQLIATYRIPIAVEAPVAEPQRLSGPPRPQDGPPRPGAAAPQAAPQGADDDDDFFTDDED